MSVSFRTGPATVPSAAHITRPIIARPVMDELLAQPKVADTAATDTALAQTPEPDGDSLYGVSGMLNDDLPIVLITPQSSRLQYENKGEVNGRAYASRSEMVWQHDGKTYEAHMDFGDTLLGSRPQTSAGQITARGLEPLRFEDRTQSPIASHFDHAIGKARLPPPVAETDMTLGAQDQLSVIIQLATILASNADRLPPGSVLAFQTFGTLASERWAFRVVGPEVVMWPNRAVSAIHVTREPIPGQDLRLDLWLAPETAYLPARIRISDGNGSFVEQTWVEKGSL